MVRKLYLVLAALPLLLAGCSGGQAPTAAGIVSRMRAASGQLTAYTADVQGTTVSGGKSRTITGREWVQKPDLFRADLMVDGKRVVTVLDGQTIYVYNQADNQVREVPVPSFGAVPKPGKVRKRSGGGDPGFTPLITGLVQRALQDYDASLAGSGTGDYVLDLKPKSGTKAPPLTMWVDAGLWLPVKVTSAGAGNSFTWEFDNLRVNPSIPAAEFQFQAPPGAVVQQVSLAYPQVTLSEAPEPSGRLSAGAEASPTVQVILEERRS